MPCYDSLGSRIPSWLRDYDRIQDLAVVLIYIQIGCALIGSLGALFNGVLLVNLVVALFALVAIESSSQSLGRTYAALLFCAIVLDVAWFILFSRSIWNFAPENYGTFFVFSLRLALSMQIIGFSVRFLSSFLWIQMYRLGPASVDNTASREVDFDVRSSFLNPPAHEIARQNSNSDDFIGGAIYDPAYYSSLFEDGEDKGSVHENWAAFEPPKTTVKRSTQVQRSRVTADKPFLKAKEKFDSQMEAFAIQQKSNASHGSTSSGYLLSEGILDRASKPALEAHSNLGSIWAKDISGSPHILGSKSHAEVGIERTSTVPPSMSPLSRISSSQSSTKELFSSPDLSSIEATQLGYLPKPLAGKAITSSRNTSSIFHSSISPIDTRPEVAAKDQASRTLDLTSRGSAPTLSMPGSIEHLADTSGSVYAVTEESNIPSPFMVPAFASAGLNGKTTEFNSMTTRNQSSGSTSNLASHSKVSVPTSSSSPLPFVSSKTPATASTSPPLTPASLAPISFGKSSLGSKPTRVTNQTDSVSTSVSMADNQSIPTSSLVTTQSQNSVIQINTTLTPNPLPAKPSVMSSFDAKSGVSNQLASVSSLTSGTSSTLFSRSQKTSPTIFTSLSTESRSSTVTEPTPATVGSVHLDKVNSKSQPKLTASGEVVTGPKNENNFLRTSSGSSPVAASLSQPEIPSSTTVLSTSTEKDEKLDISLSQDDKMEEEASDTTTLSLGSLGGFGLGSTPSSSASKPNPFGGSFLTANSSTPSPALTLTAPAGEPFRPASFSLPSAQPVLTSQPASSGGFSSGLGGGFTDFGRPAQIGVGQQALGSVLGSFGQSRQLGSGMPAVGFPSSSGFSGAGFSPAANTGGFATAGGFAGAATGGGFTSVAPAGGGFAGAAAGEGFGALPPGSDFASTATAGGGFGGAGTGASFASGGFAAFGSNQGGGFSGFSGNTAAGAGKPPAALLTQIRK